MQLDTTTYIQELEHMVSTAAVESARKSAMIKQSISTIEALTNENREMKEQIEILTDHDPEPVDSTE